LGRKDIRTKEEKKTKNKHHFVLLAFTSSGVSKGKKKPAFE
jgi:hypothetical protein